MQILMKSRHKGGNFLVKIKKVNCFNDFIANYNNYGCLYWKSCFIGELRASKFEFLNLFAIKNMIKFYSSNLYGKYSLLHCKLQFVICNLSKINLHDEKYAWINSQSKSCRNVQFFFVIQICTFFCSLDSLKLQHKIETKLTVWVASRNKVMHTWTVRSRYFRNIHEN